MRREESILSEAAPASDRSPSGPSATAAGYGQTETVTQKNGGKGSAAGTTESESRDVFADIGERDIAGRRGQLAEVLPPQQRSRAGVGRT